MPIASRRRTAIWATAPVILVAASCGGSTPSAAPDGGQPEVVEPRVRVSGSFADSMGVAPFVEGVFITPDATRPADRSISLLTLDGSCERLTEHVQVWTTAWQVSRSGGDTHEPVAAVVEADNRRFPVGSWFIDVALKGPVEGATGNVPEFGTVKVARKRALTELGDAMGQAYVLEHYDRFDASSGTLSVVTMSQSYLGITAEVTIGSGVLSLDVVVPFCASLEAAEQAY